MRFKTNTPKCPECGNSMIPRHSKHGIFWGCIMYPDCKGTRDSEGFSKDDKQREDDENVGESEDRRMKYITENQRNIGILKLYILKAIKAKEIAERETEEALKKLKENERETSS